MTFSLATLWGIIPTVIALILFFRQLRQDAKNSTQVDTRQDLEITKIWGKLALVDNEITVLRDQHKEYRGETLQSFNKIDKKLEQLYNLINGYFNDKPRTNGY